MYMEKTELCLLYIVYETYLFNTDPCELLTVTEKFILNGIWDQETFTLRTSSIPEIMQIQCISGIVTSHLSITLNKL